MSQHLIKATHNGKPITILSGYDRPLRGFFLVVDLDEDDPAFVPSDENDDEGMLYSNLWDPELIEFGGLPPDYEHFDKALKELGLTIPDRMREEILKDQLNNTGNRVVHYKYEGSELVIQEL